MFTNGTSIRYETGSQLPELSLVAHMRARTNWIQLGSPGLLKQVKRLRAGHDGSEPPGIGVIVSDPSGLWATDK